MQENWAIKRNRAGEGRLHNTFIKLRVPDFIYKELEAKAKQKNLKLSTYIKTLIKEALEKEK